MARSLEVRWQAQLKYATPTPPVGPAPGYTMEPPFWRERLRERNGIIASIVIDCLINDRSVH